MIAVRSPFYPSPGLSVLTLVKNREAHLTNLILGLARGDRLPQELVIVRMNEPEQPLPAVPYVVRQIVLQSDDPLPLARARNFAVQAAVGHTLMFLDVDCIPGAGCASAYSAAIAQRPAAVLMGGVQYLQRPLPEDFVQRWSEDRLRHESKPHPARDPEAQLPFQPEPDYSLCWTLSFALHRTSFEALGGFCEDYRGYGAEDTDFARKLEQRQVPLLWLPQARCYHQYHASQVPPRQHLHSIVRNAQVYRQRWGTWPMESWLTAFAAEGLIDWQPEDNILEICDSIR